MRNQTFMTWKEEWQCSSLFQKIELVYNVVMIVAMTSWLTFEVGYVLWLGVK